MIATNQCILDTHQLVTVLGVGARKPPLVALDLVIVGLPLFWEGGGASYKRRRRNGSTYFVEPSRKKVDWTLAISGAQHLDLGGGTIDRFGDLLRNLKFALA